MVDSNRRAIVQPIGVRWCVKAVNKTGRHGARSLLPLHVNTVAIAEMAVIGACQSYYVIGSRVVEVHATPEVVCVDFRVEVTTSNPQTLDAGHIATVEHLPFSFICIVRRNNTKHSEIFGHQLRGSLAPSLQSVPSLLNLFLLCRLLFCLLQLQLYMSRYTLLVQQTKFIDFRVRT